MQYSTSTLIAGRARYAYSTNTSRVRYAYSTTALAACRVRSMHYILYTSCVHYAYFPLTLVVCAMQGSTLHLAWSCIAALSTLGAHWLRRGQLCNYTGRWSYPWLSTWPNRECPSAARVLPYCDMKFFLGKACPLQKMSNVFSQMKTANIKKTIYFPESLL